MSLTAALRATHQRLRETLALVEATLLTPGNVQADLHDLCGLLIQRLQAHIDEDARLLAPFGHLIRNILQSRSGGDHADQRIVLRDLLVLRAGAAMKAPSGSVTAHLIHLIGELREYLEWEEREVFPLVDRVVGERAQELAGSTVVADDH